MVFTNAVHNTAPSRPPMTLTYRDVLALAQRLRTRADATIGSPQHQSDLKLAAMVITTLWEKSFHSSDVIQI